MNKKTLALTKEEYKTVILTIKSGFIYNKNGKSKYFRPKEWLAAVCTLEANLGLRIGDILHLTLSSFIRDGDRYRLNIIEEKTGKKRQFTVPDEIYRYLQDYALENGINKKQRLFDKTERCVQLQLQIVFAYLGMSGYSTHSFRKFFATSIYIDSGYNIELVRQLLQHSSCNITMKYIGIQSKELEDALKKHIHIY